LNPNGILLAYKGREKVFNIVCVGQKCKFHFKYLKQAIVSVFT